MASLLSAVASVPTRASVGASMFHHGRSKLTKEGRAQTAQFFDSVGIRPAKFWSVATGAAELFAGVAFIAGLFVRPAALALLATQAVAVWKVHRTKGYDIQKGGYEYNLALMSIALAALATGGGPLSTHRLLSERMAGGQRLPWQRLRRPTAFSRFLSATQ